MWTSAALARAVLTAAVVALALATAGPIATRAADSAVQYGGAAVSVLKAKKRCFSETIAVSGFLVPREEIAVRPDRSRPLLGNVYGGLSGPAVKPVALRIVYEAAQAVEIPIVAIGGVTDLGDVLDFLAVGALTHSAPVLDIGADLRQEA